MSILEGPPPVIRFRDQHAWASSFYDAPFYMPDMPHVTSWPTREHYFQASKAVNGSDIDWVLHAPTPGEAKRRGRKITCAGDWDSRKKVVMTRAVLTQFSAPYLPLRGLLLATGSAVLIEGNTWGDDYWGAVPYDGQADQWRTQLPIWQTGDPARLLVGQNWLGRILMMARELLA